MSFESLGRRIYEIRTSKHITSDALAELACFSDGSYIRQLERGKKLPSLPSLISLCKALGVTSDYLLYEELKSIDLPKPLETINDKIKVLTPYQLECIEALIDKYIDINSRDKIK